MVPPPKYPLYGGLVSVATAIGSLTGPVIGGFGSEKASWRWVFLIKCEHRPEFPDTWLTVLSVPSMALTAVAFFFSTPKSFPHLSNAHGGAGKPKETSHLKSFARLDIVGCLLLFSGSLLLVTVLLESGSSFSWSSAASIVLVVLSVLLLGVFFIVERFLTNEKRTQEPIFPWRFIFNRVWIGTLL